MTREEMSEIAKAAAHAVAVSGRYYKDVVPEFLDAYGYAMEKLYEKQQQAQNQSFQEFGSEENSNTAKFR